MTIREMKNRIVELHNEWSDLNDKIDEAKKEHLPEVLEKFEEAFALAKEYDIDCFIDLNEYEDYQYLSIVKVVDNGIRFFE